MQRLAVSLKRAFTATVIVLTAGLAGCGPTGYKITPVPPDRRLQESVLIDEGGFFPAKIALIDVEGVLLDRPRFTLIGEGEHPVSLLVEKLDKAASDPRVRGLVLRINSPGGTVTASDLMFKEILHFKQRTGHKRPVLAVMMDVAASGAYYVACAADGIVAHPSTVTGSIGVMMQMVNFAGTMHKLGIGADAIKSGPMKDAGSPLRHMTAEERAVFQGIIDHFYDGFVTMVADRRPGLDEAQVRELADGRVWTAKEALELGFIDQIGTLRTALAAMKQQIGAERVRVVTYHRPLGWKPNIYASQPGGPPQVNLINIDLPSTWTDTAPRFLYLWAPGW